MLLKCYSCNSYHINQETEVNNGEILSYYKCGSCGKCDSLEKFSVVGKNLELIDGNLIECDAKTYHTLCSFDAGRWSIQFGSYDKKECVEEISELKRVFKCDGVKCVTKIISTDDDQFSIDLAVAKLNQIGRG
jgi:hypothetical protein